MRGGNAASSLNFEKLYGRLNSSQVFFRSDAIIFVALAFIRYQSDILCGNTVL
jgi:hypothetical protein